MPISRVRSVTATSMMFMMPIPATISAMMPMTNAAIFTPMLILLNSVIRLALLKKSKLSSSPGCTPRSRRSTWRVSSIASSISSGVFARTVMLTERAKPSRSVEPVDVHERGDRDQHVVVEVAAERGLLLVEHADHLGTRVRRRGSPARSGPTNGKSFCAIAWPMTATLRAALHVHRREVAPEPDVVRVVGRVLRRAAARSRRSGSWTRPCTARRSRSPRSPSPTRSTVSTCSRIACAFSSVSGGRRIALRRSASESNPPAGHFCTWNVCAPRTLISCSIVAWTTRDRRS